MGFLHPQHEGLLEQMAINLDERGNIEADTKEYQTSHPKIFACGDARRGQSLVVWAISEGRECAVEVDEFLSDGQSFLAQKNKSKMMSNPILS